MLKTYRAETSTPVVSPKAISRLRDLFFPADFERLVSALNMIAEVENQTTVSVKGLLALCGWR